MRWEYLLLGTDKAPLSVAEEEDDTMNDDDVENLVGLRGVGQVGVWGFLPCLALGQHGQCPHHKYVFFGGGGWARETDYRFPKAEGPGPSSHFIDGQTKTQMGPLTCPGPPSVVGKGWDLQLGLLAHIQSTLIGGCPVSVKSMSPAIGVIRP